jgi:hypothetical protein|tara:strand:+ start:437 stop:625 length:189 start_codon:yes stop_codon:yes gene_type:complete
MCKKCKKICGVLLLIGGILFLLRDLGVWNFWNIQWWTFLFIVLGIGKVAGGKCPDCQAAAEK